MSKIETYVNNTLVVNVETRSVSNGTKTIWEVITQDGTKWATFKADLGNKAIALKGQMADLRVSIQQKDDFTNHYLEAIRPAAGSDTSGVVQAAQTAQQAQTTVVGADVTLSQFAGVEREKEDRRNEAIYRQVAAKVAVDLSKSPIEFWQNIEALLDFFRSGVVPGPNKASIEGATSRTPDTQLSSDDDIPF